MLKVKAQKAKTTFSFIMLTLGSVLAAFALENFLIPNTILDGGVTGVSIIVSKLTTLPVSLLVLVLNIPFIYVGYKNLGRGFLVRAIYSMIIFSCSLFSNLSVAFFHTKVYLLAFASIFVPSTNKFSY